MPPLEEAAVADGSLLSRYREQGAYTDCFVARIERPVTLGQFVAAFYNSRMFRPERWAIGIVLGRRAGPEHVAALAQARTDSFSAWTVEARTACEILLCDYQGRTRSWLMAQPDGHGTVLRFGSAVMPRASTRDALLFRALTGFHRAYARALLRSAMARLARMPG